MHYKFELLPLEYPYDALEPFIDTQTMHFHHDKHLQTYVDNLNKILEGYPQYQGWSLYQLVTEYSQMPESIQTPIKNNAGGVYNHNMYFEIMSKNTRPHGEVLNAINHEFGSLDKFLAQFKSAALGVFGSGYAWLVLDLLGRLKIVATPNQDSPLTDNLHPILLIDVWEHAYYLKEQNRRADYIDDFFNVINWDKVEQYYLEQLEKI